MNNTLHLTAVARLHAGLSIVPTLADKRPACQWKIYTERLMTEREASLLFRNAAGIGIVCGKVSGNLELLDFDDGGSRFEPWLAKVPPYLRTRLVVETTPSGGRHVYYRVDTDGSVPGNRKLAMKADGRVLIETRGEGGYVKCAPSGGYVLTQGEFTQMPTISQLEQELLVSIAREFDEGAASAPKPVAPSPTAPRAASSLGCYPKSSLDDLVDIRPALEASGWHRTGGNDQNEHWERPGKNERSISATFNGDVFYVFSSNAAPFEPNRGYSKRQVLRLLQPSTPTPPPTPTPPTIQPSTPPSTPTPPTYTSSEAPASEASEAYPDPGPLPETLLTVPGFVDLLAEHTMKTAPYPNRPLAFCGALTMLAHLSGRNFRDPRNLRTNIYLLALADSGVGKDFPRKVNMNLATRLGIMPTMADRFASAEGLEDALLVHPVSFFQVDEVDTLFAALQEKKDSAVEKIYGALLQFATSSDTTYAMRKKAIQQTGGKAGKFDKVRARGIREPHLTMLGCAIPKYLYGAVSERALENGLLSRCLIVEAGDRGKSGDPHSEEFDPALVEMGETLVALGGFDGLDLENLDDAPPAYVEPFTVAESDAAKARHNEVVRRCEELYDAARTTGEKALWTRGAEKAARLALLHAISENPGAPFIDEKAVDWGWALADHLTRRMLYQASVYVHDNEFDALRQKALRQLKTYGTMTHGSLLRNMHIDSDTFRKVVETLVQSELISARPTTRGGFTYTLIT